MKIALVTNFLYPDGLGGTELYCYQLANALVERGNDVYWFVPNFNSTNTESEERGKGIRVIKFAALPPDIKPALDFITGSFTSEMNARNIGIAHFNEFGGNDGISAALLAATKSAGIATVVTLHLASYVCQTGALHYGGKQPCNGKIILNRCSSCYIFSNVTSASKFNLILTRFFENVLKAGAVQSLSRIKNLTAGINLKKTFISSIGEHADIVVSLTYWFRQVLLLNNIPDHKIVYLPQVSPEADHISVLENNEPRKGYVFIGRVNKEKGVDLLLDIAVKLKKELPEVFIDLYGPYTPTDVLPHTKIANLNQFDNIRYKGILHPGDVLSVMNKYQAVILPSRVAEMASLVIMEANKLKLPVIASDVLGSVELIKQYDCGLIFKYASADDLFNKIMEMENNIHLFAFKQPEKNSFYDVAQKYEKIYAGV